MSDQTIRQTNTNSAQKKFSDSEIIDIQNELESKIQNTAPNRVINAGMFSTWCFRLNIRLADIHEASILLAESVI